MMLLLLILLQAQRRISPVVIVGAVFVFIAGVSLLVYFYRRYKRLEKETEDDWDSSRRSLFVKAPLGDSITESPVESSRPALTRDEPKSTPLPSAAAGTRDLAADLALSSFSPVTTSEAEPQPIAEAVAERVQPPAAAKPAEIQPPVVEKPESRPAEPPPSVPVPHKPELRPTEILGSVTIVEPGRETQWKPESVPPGEILPQVE